MSSASATLALLAINAPDEFTRDSYLHASKIALLQESIRSCTNCILHSRSTQRVPPIIKSASAILIGEAPGADEDKSGVPFVGRSGQKLTSILNAAGLSREEFSIANTICCRPPDNSYDYAEAMGAPIHCRPYLSSTLDLSDAWIVVIVGARALQQLTNLPRVQIKDRRGRWWWHEGRVYTAVYHPAFLLRQAGFESTTREDFTRIAEVMHAQYELPAPPLHEFKHLLDNVAPHRSDRHLIADHFTRKGWVSVWSSILDAHVLVVRSLEDPKVWKAIPKQVHRLDLPTYDLRELATLRGSREHLRRMHIAKSIIGGQLWL